MAAGASVRYGAEPLDVGFTVRFCGFAAGLRFEDLPAPVVHESKRGVLDWMGCAVAGSRHHTIATLLAGLDDLGSRSAAPILGHDRSLGILEAALVNGQSGHVLDFDDTHMDGVVLHTSSPTLASLLSAAHLGSGDGRRLILSYVLAFEAGVRVGKASPGHHDAGWHLTGTLGTIAAGCASAKFLGLDAGQSAHAIGLAATQSAGLQQNRGTMAKSFHAGKASSNGLLSAVLARRGFDSSTEIIEGRRGFLRVFSPGYEPDAILNGLGEDWQILSNGHKPYACGVVLHPAIDAMIGLHERIGAPAQVRSVDLRVHPQTIRITGLSGPRSGLQSKFSISHASAVSLLDGAGGFRQFDDARAASPDVQELARRVSVSVDETLSIDSARAFAVGADGQTHEVFVAHATGTAQNAMSDAAIERKFAENAEPVLGRDAAARLRDLIWDLDRLDDARRLAGVPA